MMLSSTTKSDETLTADESPPAEGSETPEVTVPDEDENNVKTSRLASKFRNPPTLSYFNGDYKLMGWKGLSPHLIAERIKGTSSSSYHCNGYTIKLMICFIGFALGLALCFITLGGDRKINQTAAIAIWIAVLWLTELIPLVVTAFLPLVLFPLFGILSGGDVASQYAGNTIFLFIAGVLMAMTLQRWDLHRRLSLKVLSWCGVKTQMLLLGFMIATFFLSMFVSNTATTCMMIPIALQSMGSMGEDENADEEKAAAADTKKELSGSDEEEEIMPIHSESEKTNEEDRAKLMREKCILFGIAYSANVGGMASLIGTGTNLVFTEQYAILFPDAPKISFITWLGFGLPIGIIIAIFIWGYLSWMYLRNLPPPKMDENPFKQQYIDLGQWNREQVITAAMFLLEALLWITRQWWSEIFPEPDYIEDATVGMFITIILFTIPARSCNLAEDAPGLVAKTKKQPKETTILDWNTAKSLPWDIVFLLGGGFALALGFTESGLSYYLGQELGRLGGLAFPLLLFIFLTVVIWLTELTSNAATSSIMIPVAASLAVSIEVNPLSFMIPITMACSCAFALPIATPPNMVAFSTGRIKMREMNKAGVFLNIISSGVLLMGAFTFIPWVTNTSAEEFPDWAATSTIAG